MSKIGETDLGRLLSSLQPSLLAPDYVFCTFLDAAYGDFSELKPLASFQEEEGLSLVLERGVADSHGFSYGSVMKAITLNVHSSLEAVGLTAAVASKLAEHGISANVIAANYHDHILVPGDKAEQALELLSGMGP